MGGNISEFVDFELDISDLLKLMCHIAEFHPGFTHIYCPQKLKTSAFIKDLSSINHVKWLQLKWDICTVFPYFLDQTSETHLLSSSFRNHIGNIKSSL